MINNLHESKYKIEWMNWGKGLPIQGFVIMTAEGVYVASLNSTATTPVCPEDSNLFVKGFHITPEECEEIGLFILEAFKVRSETGLSIGDLKNRCNSFQSALEKIERTYDWQQDAAGKIAHDTLTEVLNTRE